MTQLLAEDTTPFLHVLPDNTRAIALYRAIGFVSRVELPLLKVTWPDDALAASRSTGH